LRDLDLRTGWYFVTDSSNGEARVLVNSNEIYYIDPVPIVTIDNFKSIEVNQNNNGIPYLLIQFDIKGKKAWANGTGQSIGKRLALVIDNKLFHVPIVNAQINSGVSALNRGDLSESELQAIKTDIEKEMVDARP